MTTVKTFPRSSSKSGPMVVSFVFDSSFFIARERDCASSDRGTGTIKVLPYDETWCHTFNESSDFDVAF